MSCSYHVTNVGWKYCVLLRMTKLAFEFSRQLAEPFQVEPLIPGAHTPDDRNDIPVVEYQESADNQNSHDNDAATGLLSSSSQNWEHDWTTIVEKRRNSSQIFINILIHRPYITINVVSINKRPLYGEKQTVRSSALVLSLRENIQIKRDYIFDPDRSHMNFTGSSAFETQLKHK